MNETESHRFNEVYRKFETGDRKEALYELRDLTNKLADPWDKVEMLYHETLWLVELDEIPESRQRLMELKNALKLLTEPPPDQYRVELPVSLTVMARYAELRVLFMERREPEALHVAADLLSRYPKQLSTPDLSKLNAEIRVIYGLLLASTGRWAEARSFLENAVSPEKWKGIVSSCLGHCYYMLGDYESAKVNLINAFKLGLPEDRKADAHYSLGIAEYHLSDMAAAKREFELCVRTASPEYLGKTKIWEWLEETSRALGEYEEAEKYHKRRDTSTDSRVN